MRISLKNKGITMQNIRDILSANPNLKEVDLYCSSSQGIKDRIGLLVKGIGELKLLQYFSFYLHYCALTDYSFRGTASSLGEPKESQRD